jgi:hypothetical protein
MNILRQLDAVPAYFADDRKGRRIPFIVGMLLHDRDRTPRLTPAIEAAINRTVAITGRQGLVTAIVSERDTRSSVGSIVERALAIDDAILLFRCQNAETAEALMLCVDEAYILSLVRA